METDFFYVELGGFDTHNEIHEASDSPAYRFELVSLSCPLFRRSWTKNSITSILPWR